MPALKVRLADGTTYPIVSFNDSYTVSAESGDIEKSDAMRYRIICHLADYDTTMGDVVAHFTDDNLESVSVVYDDGTTEAVQVSYTGLKLARVNKYFSVESGELYSGYDVVLDKG